MVLLAELKDGLSGWIRRVFKRKASRIGIYGPPNAGKTTLANKILMDFTGETIGVVSNIPHETRRVRRREGVTIKGDGYSVTLDVVDTPGLATKKIGRAHV